MAIVGIAVVLGWAFGPSKAIGFMRLKVINDTQRAVTVQPCWDANCLQTRGLRPTVVHPGEGKKIAGKFVDDMGHLISVGILKPGKGYREIDGCVVRWFDPHTKVGVLRLSQRGACPNLSGGGGGG